MVKNTNGIYQFESFLQFPRLIHGFSTRKVASLTSENIQRNNAGVAFANSLDINQSDIVFMEQVHGKDVAVVTGKDKGEFIASSDGLVTATTGTFLCVRTADCVPLLIFDPIKKTVGVAHVGWKGAYSKIVSELIAKMSELGSKTDDIVAGIGPSIRDCCYNIESERVGLFAEQFPEYHDRIIEKRNSLYFLHLQQLVMLQLVACGMSEKNIEDSMLCTSDHADEFFSYRKREVQPFGLFGGVIGIL